MPDGPEDDDREPEGEEEQAYVPRKHIRELERQAKEARDLKERLVSVERDAAFARALGTALTEPKMGYFVKGYEGDLDPEAIRNAAMEAGFLTPPPSPQSPAPATPDLSVHERIQAAASGEGPPPGTDWEAALRNAKSQEEVLDIVERYGGLTTRMIQ